MFRKTRLQTLSWGIRLLTYREGRRDIRGRRRRRYINNRGRRGRGGKPGGRQLQTQQRREWPKSVQELRGVTLKWTRRVEVRQAHLNRNPGARRAYDKHLPNRLR